MGFLATGEPIDTHRTLKTVTQVLSIVYLSVGLSASSYQFLFLQHRFYSNVLSNFYFDFDSFQFLSYYLSFILFQLYFDFGFQLTTFRPSSRFISRLPSRLLFRFYFRPVPLIPSKPHSLFRRNSPSNLAHSYS